ncbi:hypothetical protein [Tenacibaculum sp. C7A-26P2]|uniref:hypothetical protein n=1 Tax=Tenacibaculum sp. C7A-26P2 TaxID=3447504 RepID=UPI003F85E369
MKTKIKITIIAIILMNISVEAQEKITTENGAKSDFIYKDGKISLGNNDPIGKLDISSTSTIGGYWNPANSTIKVGSSSSSLILDPNEIYGSSTLYFGAKSGGSIAIFRSVDENGNNDKFFINRNGFIGIGKNPFTNLQVHSNGIDSRIALTNNHSGSNASDGFVIINENDSEVHLLNRENTSIKFSTNGNERLRISDEGDIGIGVTQPKMKLELGGLSNYDGIKLGNYFKIRTSSLSSNHFVLENIAPTGNLYIRSKVNGTLGDLILNDAGGNVAIGTTNTKGFKLGVNGKIAATEVKVATYSNWADFVFKEDYHLPTLLDVENHIKEKGHLKDIPSAKEVEQNGFFLGEMDAKLLQKIEELTLYTIEQEKKLVIQQKEIEELKEQNSRIKDLEILVQKLLKNKK